MEAFTIAISIATVFINITLLFVSYQRTSAATKQTDIMERSVLAEHRVKMLISLCSSCHRIFNQIQMESMSSIDEHGRKIRAESNKGLLELFVDLRVFQLISFDNTVKECANQTYIKLQKLWYATIGNDNERWKQLSDEASREIKSLSDLIEMEIKKIHDSEGQN
ncbi:hypothetical protein DL240_03995 [Lujinxingia litoralis]|uniref:DUF4760 domain-containing protein n=1 Tax=Lujinxingia litoralis TaxID=2211119 RepID=A0A328CCI5_9DELT|nr:hypothetical protein [Lujinxingia litoralis]RAL25380.1 hypothetical protein DL240_03995 [Lujinxingia litoralis]